jgi:hypothetical protein
MIITRLFSLQQLYCTSGVFFFPRLMYDGCCAAVIAYKSNHSPSRYVAPCTGAQIFSQNIIRSADNVLFFVSLFGVELFPIVSRAVSAIVREK